MSCGDDPLPAQPTVHVATRWLSTGYDAEIRVNRIFTKHYVVAVRADFAVARSRRGGPTPRADVLVGVQAARSWRSVTWREGSQGWMRGRFVALRGWRVTSSGHCRAGWLIGEDASDGKRRYYWSNFGPEAGLTHHFSLGFLGFSWKIQDIHMMLSE